MKEYTLAEIKAELFSEIEALENIEPVWKNCRKCPFHGKCCIDNDIDIREDEWKEIETCILSDRKVYDEVRKNFLHDQKCYFRTQECCLIHEVRPTNCIYTPYQLIRPRFSGDVYYSSRSSCCDFENVGKKDASLSFYNDFIVKVDDRHPYYLYLNYWFENFENKSVDCYKMTGKERLSEFFTLYPSFPQQNH